MTNDDRSKVIHNRQFRWAGVPTREYKAESSHFFGVTRQTLLGEGADEQALKFVTRYFEVQPGGYSSLEHHDHPHCVVVLRGSGEVVLQDRVEAIERYDVVYVAPWTFHQFHATGDGPLGFLCIVDRERDRPQLPGDEELETLRENNAVGRVIRI